MTAINSKGIQTSGENEEEAVKEDEQEEEDVMQEQWELTAEDGGPHKEQMRLL